MSKSTKRAVTCINGLEIWAENYGGLRGPIFSSLKEVRQQHAVDVVTKVKTLVPTLSQTSIERLLSTLPFEGCSCLTTSDKIRENKYLNCRKIAWHRRVDTTIRRHSETRNSVNRKLQTVFTHHAQWYNLIRVRGIGGNYWLKTQFCPFFKTAI